MKPEDLQALVKEWTEDQKLALYHSLMAVYYLKRSEGKLHDAKRKG